MTTKAPTAIRMTRFLAGPAVAIGLALGSAAVADALPEWDIGEYDDCVSEVPTDHTSPFYWDHFQACCIRSGGIWDDSLTKCVAPPAESQGRNPLPSDAPTHVMQPSPLPGQGGDLGPAPGGVLTSP